MRILVCIKQVPDTETKIKLQSDHTGIDDSGVKWIMNPYDEFAVEEALKLKQAHSGSTVTVLSMGPQKRVVDSLRTALAMGADDGWVIDTQESLDAHAAAQGVAHALKEVEPFQVIFTGTLAIDDNAASFSQHLAEFLGWPHATLVSKFETSGEGFLVEREAEGGNREILQLNGPAVIAANKGLNTPRYASLPGIMKAKKKPLKETSWESLDVGSEEVKIHFHDFQMPPEKPPVKMLDGEADQQAQQLVQLLHEEAKVL